MKKMNSQTYIIEKQQSWASRKGFSLIGSQNNKGRKLYTKTIDENLFQPLDTNVFIQLLSGDGGEVTNDGTNPCKLQALHSSSALGVNIFQYWLQKGDLNSICSSCGLTRHNNNYLNSLAFERKLKINESFSKAPNIDVLIENKPGYQYKGFGIECKFSEAYDSRGHKGISNKYLQDLNDDWEDIPSLKNLAQEICPNDHQFKHLHAAQLVKHILGLKRKYGKGSFKLLYLWYDTPGKEGYEHRHEIEKFQDIAFKDNIKFLTKSYQELIIALYSKFYSGNEKYAAYLCFCKIGFMS